jgi:hypothetical protein
LQEKSNNSIVHIGYHKTATNWFQRYYYPQVTNAEYLHRKKARAAFLSDSGFKFSRTKALHELGVAETRRIILCEEELSGNIHNGGLYGFLSKETAIRIKEVLPDCSVVIFIRNQLSMISSVYSQYIREGGTHSPERYLFHEKYLSETGFSPRYAPLFSFDHFEYLPLVKHYQEVFGEEQVFVYPYEAFNADTKTFMKDFEDSHNIHANWTLVKNQRVNQSYKRHTLYLARLLNLFTYRDVTDKRILINIPYFYKFRRHILKVLNYLPISSAPTAEDNLGREVTEFIRQRYSISNNELRSHLKLPLEKYGYPL